VAGATCDGDHTVTGADKKPRDCAPYKCKKDGSCGKECTSVIDCVAPAVCDASGKCVTPPEQAGDGGCAVRPGAPGHSSHSAFVLLALLALARRRSWKEHVG
jgi:MYXO-CTERM domain-containing protein